MKNLLVVFALLLLVLSCGSTPDEPHVRPGQLPDSSDPKKDTIPNDLPTDTIIEYEPTDSVWRNIGEATFYDGWLLGVISFEARPPLDPSQNPWFVSVENTESYQIPIVYVIYIAFRHH